MVLVSSSKRSNILSQHALSHWDLEKRTDVPTEKFKRFEKPKSNNLPKTNPKQKTNIHQRIQESPESLAPPPKKILFPQTSQRPSVPKGVPQLARRGYTVQNAAGQTVRSEEGARSGEQGLDDSGGGAGGRLMFFFVFFCFFWVVCVGCSNSCSVWCFFDGFWVFLVFGGFIGLLM